MTFFGKILVMMATASSLLMAGWALALYTNRVNWSNMPAKATAEQPQGELARRKERFDEAKKFLEGAAGFYGRTRGNLIAGEKQRLDLVVNFYPSELKKVNNGPEEVQVPAFRAGELQLDPATGRPTMEPLKVKHLPPPVPAAVPAPEDVGIKHFAFYKSELEKVTAEIAAAIKRLEELLDEEKKLSVAVNGDKDTGVKGLRQRIFDEEAALLRVEMEIEELKPIDIKARDEAQQLEHRRKQMEERRQELERAPKKVGVAARNP